MVITESYAMDDLKYSILVNTSDGYEDCWGPFFKLLKKYWPDCDAPIYLNTGKKIWTTSEFPNLISCQSERSAAQNLTWSQCLLNGLECIETPLVLYFQEDYFVDKYVDSERIKQAVEYMVENDDVSHIALTKHCSLGPYDGCEVPWLQKIQQSAKYRISTQAGLWRVNKLISYINSNENGWMFEIYGSMRAKRITDVFLSAKWDDRNGPVIDYIHTGIIKGKWKSEIVDVFRANDIDVNFTIRGFYVMREGISSKLDLLKKVLEQPIYAMKQLFNL